jgi:hypothetical protein
MMNLVRLLAPSEQQTAHLNAPDQSIWRWTANGKYTDKSVYAMLHQGRSTNLHVVSSFVPKERERERENNTPSVFFSKKKQNKKIAILQPMLASMEQTRGSICHPTDYAG